MAKGLGRGLNAFFGEDEESTIEQVTKKSSKYTPITLYFNPLPFKFASPPYLLRTKFVPCSFQVRSLPVAIEANMERT